MSSLKQMLGNNRCIMLKLHVRFLYSPARLMPEAHYAAHSLSVACSSAASLALSGVGDAFTSATAVPLRDRSLADVRLASRANVHNNRCISFLDTMLKLGRDATLQLLWLYERYNIPNAGGRMTKCAMDHFGRDMGETRVRVGLP